MSQDDITTAFLGTLTGNDPTGRGDPNSDREKVKQAVAKRFTEIQGTLIKRPGLEHSDWSKRHLYDGNRCKPENLGWRFIQSYGMHSVEDILSGKCDREVEGAWHENASAEYWYAYEKDWG